MKNDTATGERVDRIADMMTWIPAPMFEKALPVIDQLHNNHNAMLAALPAFGKDRMSYIFPYGSYDSEIRCIRLRIESRAALWTATHLRRPVAIHV